MMLKGKTYDTLKSIALVWLPAVGVLYAGLAALWNFPAAEQVGGSVLVVDTFLGAILQLSSATYNKMTADATPNRADKDYDGVFSVEYSEEGNQALRLKSVDYHALNTKKELLFKLEDGQSVKQTDTPS